MPHYYPIFLNQQSRLCLVVGAGPVGARKAAGLLEAGANVRLVATQISDAAAGLRANYNVELLQEPYREEHLDSVVLAFAATDNRLVNAQIVMDAGGRNIPVNSADSQEHSSEAIHDNVEFVVPAILRRGDLCIAISTGGASPKLAQKIRSDLEAVYSVKYAAYVELLRDMRGYIRKRIAPAHRSAALESLITDASQAVLQDLLRDDAGSEALEAARSKAREIVEAALAELLPSE